MEAVDSEVVQANNTAPQLKDQAEVSEAAQANNMVPHLRELAEAVSVDVHLNNMEPHQLVPHPSNTEPHLPHLSSTEPHLAEALLLNNTVPHLLHLNSTELQVVETDMAAADTRLAPHSEADSLKLRLAATPRMAMADMLPTEATAPVDHSHPSQLPSHSHTLKPEATTTKH